MSILVNVVKMTIMMQKYIVNIVSIISAIGVMYAGHENHQSSVWWIGVSLLCLHLSRFLDKVT